MAPETVTPAIFFGEDREIAVAATGFEEVLAGLIEAHEVIRQSAACTDRCRSGLACRLLPAHCPLARRRVFPQRASGCLGDDRALALSRQELGSDRAAAAVSSATDLQRAFQQGMIGETKPLACCYICVENCPESRLTGPPPTARVSLTRRLRACLILGTYEGFCHRLLDGGLYDAACFATRTRTEQGVRVGYPAPRLSFTTLLSKIRTTHPGCRSERRRHCSAARPKTRVASPAWLGTSMTGCVPGDFACTPASSFAAALVSG